jgi:hypothetical protein
VLDLDIRKLKSIAGAANITLGSIFVHFFC